MRRWISDSNVTALSSAALVAVAFDLGLHVGQSRADPPTIANAIEILGSPSLVTCPTANCPSPPRLPVLSSEFVHGSTTKGADQPEWLSNIGLFVRTGSPDGQKVAQYVGVMQQKGAGTAWALNTDLVRNAGLGGPNAFDRFEGSGKPGLPGSIGDRNGSIGYELDFTNWDADSSPGRGAFTVGQYIHAQGSFTSLAAIYFVSKMADSNKSFGWEDGLLFNGERAVHGNSIADSSSSINSFQVMGKHETAINTTQANEDIVAIRMRTKQSICFDVFSSCLSFADGKLAYKNAQGVTVFTLDEDGNAFFAGRVSSRR